MMKKLLLLSLLTFSQISAQDYGNNADSLEICAAIQGNSFMSDAIADEALERILSVIGVSKTFVMMPCHNINNAVAVSLKGIRYIIYDPSFMAALDNGDDWSNLFILAHEVGHHINGHSLDIILYVTESVETKSLAQKKKQELEADEFAGFILGKLGATLEQTSSSINLLASDDDDTYSTHPSKFKRLSSIETGYNRAIGKSAVVKQYRTKTLSAEEYFYSAYSKYDLQDYYGAIADYTKAIEIDPNYTNAYVNRGISKYNLQDYYGACQDARKAQELGYDASPLIKVVCN